MIRIFRDAAIAAAAAKIAGVVFGRAARPSFSLRRTLGMKFYAWAEGEPIRTESRLWIKNGSPQQSLPESAVVG